MGPSGAGKSTLLSVLMGTARGADFQGQVWINGRVMRVSRLRRIMGYVPQVGLQAPNTHAWYPLCFLKMMAVDSGIILRSRRCQDLIYWKGNAM